MGWASIWKAIQGLMGGLKEVKKWKMSIDGKANKSVTAVSFGSIGATFKFKVDDAGDEITLQAVPGDANHAVVMVNGAVDDDAKLVFMLKHQPLKPLIAVFRFEGVTIGGATKVYRFDNPR